MQENNELDGKLTADEQRFYDEFERDANNGTETDWGRERQKSKRRDITNRARSLPVEFVTDIPVGGWERHIIDAIDAERNARESNDIAPGIVKDGRIYRCAKFIPGYGSLRANFMDEESARNYMAKLEAAYARLCR